FVGAVHAVAIDEPGARLRQVAVPDLVGALVERDAPDLVASVVVEQAQLDQQRVAREQREVDAFAVPGGAQRIRPARPRAIGHRTSFSTTVDSAGSVSDSDQGCPW